MTTRHQIREWLLEAKQRQVTHMLVVCDTFDYEVYPVFVQTTDRVETELKKYDSPPTRGVFEVYALHLDVEAQLREVRSWHPEYETTGVTGQKG